MQDSYNKNMKKFLLFLSMFFIMQTAHATVLEAGVSLSDVSELDLLIKKIKADKRIYEVHHITSLS